VARRPREREGDGLRKHDRAISIVEAILLAIVALLAAYTGFASAKWEPSPPSSSQPHPQLARRRTERLDAMDTRNFDSTTFNTWFSAYLAGNTSAENVAERRFRPPSRWRSMPGWQRTRYELVGTSGPTYMKQYKQPSWRSQTPWTRRPTRIPAWGPGRSQLRQLRARHHLSRHHSLPDRHQRHFRYFRIRLALVSLGALMLLVAVAQILSSPAIP